MFVLEELQPPPQLQEVQEKYAQRDSIAKQEQWKSYLAFQELMELQQV